MDTSQVLVELAKVAVNSFFTYMKLANKTQEEIEEIFKAEERKFLLNDPSKLEDV